MDSELGIGQRIPNSQFLLSLLTVSTSPGPGTSAPRIATENRGSCTLRIDKSCSSGSDTNCHFSASGEASVRHSGTRIACKLFVLGELYKLV